MIQYTAHILLVIFFAVGCSQNSLSEASKSYKKHHDYNSLKIIFGYLSIGMKKEKVTYLLGKADYSPSDNIFYYSSDYEDYLEEYKKNKTGYAGKVPVGIVITYKKSGQSFIISDFWLGPIGE